jgi:nifR3 family TIM-barrel protein
MRDNFWQKLKKPFTVLAPMANVTDWAFRRIVLETGRPDVFFTEFISADGIIAIGRERFKGELYFEKNERPVVVQFFTAKPENMYKCSQLAQELGFDGIDINMGCPDKSIEKQGAGAALMKNPKLARELIKEAIRGAGPLPVSVKTRLGFNKIDHEWIQNLIDTDIIALSVHARTRKEMSKVPAHWDEMGKISEMAGGSGKLIIGNGDVSSMDDVREKAKTYNLDGIMVGRGIFQNPWFFSGQVVDEPKKRIDLLLKHLDNFEKLWGENKNFDTMKRFFKIYIQNWPGAKELRTELMTVKSKKEAVDLLSKYL